MIKYFFLVLIGLVIILLCSLIQEIPARPRGESYYTSFLHHNYTLPAKALFVITGFVAGYVYRLNPWLIGISLILIFPLTSIVEATLYRGEP